MMKTAMFSSTSSFATSRSFDAYMQDNAAAAGQDKNADVNDAHEDDDKKLKVAHVSKKSSRTTAENEDVHVARWQTEGSSRLEENEQHQRQY